MRRRNFMKGVAGAGLVSLLPTVGCNARGAWWDLPVNFDGRVVVVGAGAAGLAAGYLLDRYGIDYTILEASSRWGGRVQRLEGFIDVPIDLGAEWLHDQPAALADAIDDSRVDARIDLVRYAPQTTEIWNGSRLQSAQGMRHVYGEYKFKSTTWHQFLEDWILPASLDRLQLDTPVVAIDSSGSGVTLHLADGSTEEADRVVLAVPLKILQEGLIEFTPELPESKRNAIDDKTVVDGLKVFLEMDSRFYPDLTFLSPLAQGGADHLAMDGVFRKDVSQNLLSLFCVGQQAAQYVDLDDDDIVERLLQHLDAAYDGAASRNLLQARVQNWNQEPWIQGAYVYGSSALTNIDELAASVDDRLYWAGGAVTQDNIVAVHGAMNSGYAAVAELLNTPG
ncbi:MAG: FAD-dependent oxidoreductase [Proteobacteria bacterium]|nr:FAD-dependent oxidoreductase [Pseudomonadota bacterium]MCP4919021.1 FAD-dependent oxidoreductase [Pseudomonadota bacterium]